MGRQIFNSLLWQSFNYVLRAEGSIDSEWALVHSAIAEEAVADSCHQSG